MQAVKLSPDAVTLLRYHLTGRRFRLKGPKPEGMPGRTVEETLAAYRELASAGLMYPVSGFAHGPESLYRLTDAAWERRYEWLSGPGLRP